MKTIVAIAENTFRETIRDRVLYNILFFAMGMILLSLIASQWSINQQDKILKDFGLSVMTLFGLLISVFIGVGLVHKEVEKKTIYVIISKPIHRFQFILGKYFGLLQTIFITMLIMTAAFYLILFAVRSEFDAMLLLGVFAIYMEMLFVVAFALLFSSFTTPMLSAIFSIFIYIGGHFSADIKLIGPGIENAVFKSILNILHYLLPNLAYFDIKQEIVHGLDISARQFGFSLLYSAIYLSIILMITVFVFQRRDFK